MCKELPNEAAIFNKDKGVQKKSARGSICQLSTDH
jgi:hypothetical protein